jgi:hypothetical protein
MRKRGLIGLGVGALAALVASQAPAALPAAAQPGLSRVADPRGLFSIGLPADWRVADTEISGTVFAGLQRSGLADHVLSRLAAHSAPDDPAGPAILLVIALDNPVPAAAFGQNLRRGGPEGWTVTNKGPARIAGRDAYYVYLATQRGASGIYMVIAYFKVGTTGFAVIGATYNQPAAIQKHFATISRILETFRPGVSSGAAR